MPRLYEAVQPLAPRLYLRRRAQLIFPWGMFFLMGVIFVYSHWQGTSLLPRLIWLIIVACASMLFEIITPHSLIVHYYRQIQNFITPDEFHQLSLSSTDELYSIYPEPLFFKHRHWLRWLLTLLITVFTWGLIVSNWNQFSPGEYTRGMLLLSLLILYSIIPFGILALESMRNVIWGQHVVIWIIFVMLGGISTTIGAYLLVEHWLEAAFFGIMALFVFTGFYLNQRLWIGEKVIGDVIRRISLRVLDIEDIPQALESDIPELIGKLLRYSRVSILTKDPNHPELKVIGTYGNFSRSMIGEKLDREKGGITWRAMEKNNVVAWNDIQLCPYYRSITGDKEIDETRAELAIPITYQGDIYGVLDVQSSQAGLYGPGDVGNLRTIAKIIGTAIANYDVNQRLIHAGELWNQLTVSTNSTEEGLFYTFARFAEEQFGADISVYYPLSPTGFPHKKPFTYGNLNYPDMIRGGITNYDGPLVHLIHAWEYYPSPQARNDLRYRDSSTNLLSPFIEREEISSNYFVPIGVSQEPLGALFLNFKTPKQFDNLFNLMIRSFAQAFATVTWKNRYRELVYESFGSPAYVVHYKRGQYGLKAGVSKDFRDYFQNSRTEGKSAVEIERLLTLTSRVDRFLDEIQFEEELVPPDFWDPEITLKREILDFIYSRPQSLEQERQPNVKLDFDFRLERENPVVKLALYRVVSEAINNAIVHGKAANTMVYVQRQTTSIDIQVVNNGMPLAEDYLERRAALTKGILYLFDRLESGFGAKTSIRNREAGKGAFVRISIPALSNTSKNN